MTGAPTGSSRRSPSSHERDTSHSPFAEPKSSRGSRRAAPRDQDTSTFTQILERLLGSVSGSVAAALVDGLGETVDYAGAIDAFEIKVAAAHWQIVVREIDETLGSIRQLTVRARGKSFVVRPLHMGYLLVLVLGPLAGFSASERALHEAHGRLCAEAGFPRRRASTDGFGSRSSPNATIARAPLASVSRIIGNRSR